MTVFNRNRHSGSSGVAAYAIENSCRFNDGDSPITAHTYNAVGSSNKIATLSWWMKLGTLGIARNMFDFDSGQEQINLHTNNKMRITYASVEALVTTHAFRDPTAWYHCVFRIDTTDSTAGDRLRLYVNGVEVTVFDTDSNPSINTIMGGIGINTNVANIGAQQSGAAEFDGYLTEIAMCDGQSLAPTSFGETDDNGNWVPIDLSGLTFGNNGFWLNAAVAPGTGNGFGTDVSGKGNHFTDSGLAANDQVPDSPSDKAASGVGNYCTMNPLVFGGVTLSNGNLDVSCPADKGTLSTMGMSGGKWRFEGTVNSGIIRMNIGVCSSPKDPDTDIGFSGGFTGECVMYQGYVGNKILAAAYVSYGASYTDDDVIDVFFDYDTGTVWFAKNGTLQNSATEAEVEAVTTTNAAATGLTFHSDTAFFTINAGGSGTATWSVNFGQYDYANDYSGITLYKNLYTPNLPAPPIADSSSNMNFINFTGGGTAAGSGGNAFTWSGSTAMQADFILIRDTDTSVETGIYDSSNGATKELNINDTSALETVAESLLSFDSDGFTLGSDATVNTSSSPNMAVGLKEDVAAGFAINHNVAHTSGTPTNIAHGLGAAPNMVWAKRTDSTGGWYHYHSNMNGTLIHSHKFINTTALETTLTDAWGTHTSTNTIIDTLPSGTYTIYSFVDVTGFHKSFIYEGNSNANGPFVYLGFRPKWAVVAHMDGSVDAWHYKTKTPNVNPVDHYLSLDTTGVVGTYSGYQFDYVAAGLKLAGGAATTTNAGGTTYFGMAWAEFPFGGDGVSQGRAR